MSLILGIDPGSTFSAYTLIESSTCSPVSFDKVPNDDLLMELEAGSLGYTVDLVAVEMIASYGMAVGAEVFETCVWIGRFSESVRARTGQLPTPVKRSPVKLHHCHSSKAKDSNIIQALVDRFAMGQANKGKGTKAQPGWFYGFSADIWQAYALAVYAADRIESGEAL